MKTRKGTKLATATLAALALAFAATAAGCATSGGFTGGISPTEIVPSSAPGPAGFVLPEIARPEVRENTLRIVTLPKEAEVQALYDAIIVARGSDQEWGKYIALQYEVSYAGSSGATKLARFTVVYGNLKRVTIPEGTQKIKGGASIGISSDAGDPGTDVVELFVAVSSAEYDEMLVLDAGPLCKHAGLYWYEPNIIIPTTTKWLSYPPIDHADTVSSMVEHGRTEPESTSIYATRCRFTMPLGEYPKPSRDLGFGMYPLVEYQLYSGRVGVNVFSQIVEVKGYKLILCWQRGFDGYLREDWVLGSDITLFGHFVTYDVKQDAAVFFIKDYSAKTVEERLAERPESALPTID